MNDPVTVLLVMNVVLGGAVVAYQALEYGVATLVRIFRERGAGER